MMKHIAGIILGLVLSGHAFSNPHTEKDSVDIPVPNGLVLSESIPKAELFDWVNPIPGLGQEVVMPMPLSDEEILMNIQVIDLSKIAHLVNGSPMTADDLVPFCTEEELQKGWYLMLMQTDGEVYRTVFEVR